MRARESGVLVVVILLTAVALSPLLRADQPCTHDGGLHYYRVVAMDQAMSDGLLVSRWVPDLAFGYGYPFFNYRAAVSYYLALALYLTGLSLPQALNAVYVIALAGSAIGAYLLGRDLFGRGAGLVAAVAYVYAPYALIDALVRGNMPESVGLAMLPFILWSFRRLLLSGRARYLLSSAGMLALLFLSHNISSLLFTPFLVLYLLVVWLARGRRDHLVASGVALALGVGLSAFFWAPAVLEQNDAQLYMSRTARNNDYHYNFLGLSEVLAPPEAADTSLLNPPLRLPLGLTLVLMAALGSGLGLWRWRRGLVRAQDRDAGEQAADGLAVHEGVLGERERWMNVAFFALSGLAMVVMATRASLVVWESLPLIPFVQFPWRFIGRAVLPFSFLAAALVAALPGDPKDGLRNTPYAPGNRAGVGRLASLSMLAITCLLILSALPLTYPSTGYCPAKAQPDMMDLFAYERSTGLVGVDPLGSYFPVTVQTRPTGSPLEAQYAAMLAQPDGSERMPIARLDTISLPEGAVVHQAEYTPNRAILELETPSAARVRYLALAFPGWRVLIDSHQSEIVPSEPEGLITFDLPAGRHRVEVDWGSTPIRAVATIVSLVALAGVAFIGYTAMRDSLVRRIRAEPAQAAEDALTTGGIGETFVPGAPLSWNRIVALAGLALLLLGFKLVFVDRTHTLFRRPGLSADGTLPGVSVPLDVRFEDGVRLLGYDRSTGKLPTDGTLHLAFYWSANARPSRSYKATVTLVGPDGQLGSPKTAFPRRGYGDLPPSPAWGNGRYAVDGLDVEPLPGTPPGRYDLLLTAFDRETLAPLNVVDDAGRIVAPNLSVGQIELTRASRSPDPAGMPMQMRLEAELGPLILAGANLDRNEAAPGDPVLVTLFWHARGGGRVAGNLPDLRLHLVLAGEDGAEAKRWELPPVREDWPTTLWQRGDVWRGQHALRLPAGLESGRYRWQLQLFETARPETHIPQALVELGELRMEAPERLWEAPPLGLALETDLGQSVRLLGADVAPPEALTTALQGPATLRVTLAWQARVEMETSYRIFLHLLRPDGSLLVQADGEPVDWTRPTTGWAVGEIIMETRTLEIPADALAGEYRLVAGLYDPDTGQRLPLPDGSTAVHITSLTLSAP